MGFHTQSGHSQHDNFDTTVDDLFPGYFVPEDDFGMGTGVQFNDDLGFVMNTPYSYCPEALQNTEQQQMTPGHETFMVNPNPLTFMPQGMGQGMNTLPMGVMPAASDVPRFTPEATMHANQASSYMNIGIASPHFQVAGTSTTQSSAQTHTFRAMNINTPPLHTEMAGTSMSPPSAQTHHSRLGNISTPSPA
ncbi:hypothetical protein BZA77DRAFT_356828 [Pyronema omphalodes]|nr:hypothetical protein BZA77DRAFT_357655 [Pyronema omphalodes]KAI5814310.1 hypothetical protein BZA77DRAFT_356828 [Pyronema omphalodes]